MGVTASCTGTTGKGNEDCSLIKSKIDEILGAQPAARLEDHLRAVHVVRGEEQKVGDQALTASRDYRPQSGLSDAGTLPDTLGNCFTAFIRELRSFRDAWNALTPQEWSLVSDRGLPPTTDWLPILERLRRCEQSTEDSTVADALSLASRADPVVDETQKFVTSDPVVFPVRTNRIQQMIISMISWFIIAHIVHSFHKTRRSV